MIIPTSIPSRIWFPHSFFLGVPLKYQNLFRLTFEDRLFFLVKLANLPNGDQLADGWYNKLAGANGRERFGAVGYLLGGSSVSQWLVSPIYKPFSPFGRGITLLRGLTNHGY